MKITFEVDENFVDYFTDGGISKKDIKSYVEKFIKEVILEEVDDCDDLVFMTKFEDYLGEIVDK